MTDTRGLLDRISAFRRRLEAAPHAVTQIDSNMVTAVETPEAFQHHLRQIVGSNPSTKPEGPLPVQLTSRAHQALKSAKNHLDRHRKFSNDPFFSALSADSTNIDPLVDYHRETVAMMDSAVRLAQVLPGSPSLQLKLCDGLEGVLSVVGERLQVQERALARRRTDADRIDRLANVLSSMSQMRPMNANMLAALGDELLEEARQTSSMRFLSAPPFSTEPYPGGDHSPSPARFVAAHSLNVAQVVARIVNFDFEWSGRPLLPVVASLLMDSGMMRIAPETLAREGSLTADERRLIEQHPRFGAELIVRYIPDSAPLAAGIATHHERHNGTGYPLGLKGHTIPSLGRMLATADIYAAMCGARPYREAQDTRKALTDVLLMAERDELDRDFAEYLVNLSFYPVGSVVELADGRIGVIAANQMNRLDPRAPGRPVVALLAEADGTLLSRPEHLDLSSSSRGSILRTLPADKRRKILGHRYPDLL